jgi:dipeptidyl aminopeptidase/acylaminoacyl peptidase
MTAVQQEHTTATRRLEPDDLMRIRALTDAQISPDGTLIAYAVKIPDLERNEYRSVIYLIPTAGGEARQLTEGTARDTTPRWSPDGTQIAFVSDRGGSAQLYVTTPTGDEPRQLTSLAYGVTGLDWSPRGDRLMVLSAAGSDQGDTITEWPGGPIRRVTRLRYRFDVMGYMDGKVQQLWIVPLQGGGPWQLTNGSGDTATPAWSPDGTQIAFVTNREDDVDLSFKSHLYTIAVPAAPGDAAADDGARLLDKTARHVGSPAWSPDGERIAYIALRADAPTGGNNNIFVVTAAGGTPENVTGGWDRSPGLGIFSDTWSAGAALFWSPDGKAQLFTAPDQGRLSFFRAAGGTVETVLSGERTIGFVSTSADGAQLAFVAGDMTNPCDLYTAAGDGSGERRLTDLNADVLGGVPLITPERLPFTAFDGRFEVDAWLLRPVGYQEGRTYPLVQIIHGGPHSIFGYTFFFDMQLWANCGWNVLFINPRALQGYGEDFATANLGDWGGADWKEQEAALDLVIARGGVDTDRLAVTGLSYGGYMTNWIIGHSDRYKVAASENSVSNLVTHHTTSDIGWFWTEGEWGDKPVWSNLDYYMAHSPISYVDQITTPTLFLQAEGDWRCPIEQGEQMYTALMSRGVPCEMIRFPGDSHTLLSTGKPRSRLERRRHNLRWFAKYPDV